MYLGDRMRGGKSGFTGAFPVLLGLLLSACGPMTSDNGMGFTTAAIEVPRALADELATVEVYVFRVKDNHPTSTELTSEFPAGSGKYEAYKEYSATKTVTIAFQADQEAIIDGIPDRGPVWLFYARGIDSITFLIAQGVLPAPIRVSSDSDEPTDVLIRLDPIGQ